MSLDSYNRFDWLLEHETAMHYDTIDENHPVPETAPQEWPHRAAAARLRLITAASLFDGDDAAVHIMRRLIQTHATEVVHLGHHRSVEDVVRAALQEDADAIAVSTHRGGHGAYFRYMIDMLRARGAGHIAVFVSCAQAFAVDEIAELDACGVARIYHAHAGEQASLARMIADMIERASRARDSARGHNRPAVSAVPQRPPTGNEGNAISEPSYAWWPTQPPAPRPEPVPVPASSIRWEYGAFERQGTPVLLNRNDPPRQGAHTEHAYTWEMEDTVPTPLSPAPPGQIPEKSPPSQVPVRNDPELTLGRMITRLEEEHCHKTAFHELRKRQPWVAGTPPVIGITGTGGAGKSSVTDELLTRFLASFPDIRIAVLSVDPTRRRSGGALLGDRIRMNALRNPRVYMRSMATRRQHLATSAVLQDCIQCLREQDFDLVIVETAGIGQSDSTIVDLVDLPVYVMTSDYGAASQLEKIDMLDYAELIVLNKYDQRGAADALHDVRQQWRRHRHAWDVADDQIPVYPTIASHCNDPGMNWMFVSLCRILHQRQQELLPNPLSHLGMETGVEITAGEYSANQLRCDFNPPWEAGQTLPDATGLIPPQRIGYLAEIAEQGRAINTRLQSQADELQRAQQCWQALGELGDPARPAALAPYPEEALSDSTLDASLITLRRRYQDAIGTINTDALHQLRQWQQRLAGMTGDLLRVESASKAIDRQSIANIAAPHYRGWGELLRFVGRENLPGGYPYTSGIAANTPSEQHAVRIFAAEGTPERSNRQFHALRQEHPAIHLVSAFDRLTLYGEDPDQRPDIAARIGHGGVSIPTLDAMKKLYSGFDLCAEDISVSITANGPAPILMAMFINTAIDQQVEQYLREDLLRWQDAQQKIDAFFMQRPRPDYDAELPPGHDTLGLGLLGISGDQLVDADTYARIKAHTLSRIRGRVQMDVLEEEQARNTCIFSPGFAIRMLGDMQQYCVEHGVVNFHLTSISGTCFTEVGANPITQLAFTLANGFTLVEYYLARGIRIDEIAPDLMFSFCIGDDLEYSVLGRVARRIWARAMRERYDGNQASQQFKYHMHALNDRGGTFSGESMRHGALIPAILRRELKLEVCENPWQSSFIIETLTDLVEEAVYREFEAISARGGVFGAMDSTYQRDRIQDEWMQRTRQKSTAHTTQAHESASPGHDTAASSPQSRPAPVRLRPEEASRQIDNVRQWQSLRNHPSRIPGHHEAAGNPQVGSPPHGLAHLQYTARGQGNLFAALLEAVKTHSLGQITRALYAAGGEYRRTI